MSTQLSQSQIEAVGAGFDMAQLLEQRQRTLKAIEAIAAAIVPGMREEAAVMLANQLLGERGMRRGWHKVNVRFGINTTLHFHTPSQPDVVLGDDDIFFIDIGPVFEHWEGDGGDTFVTGRNPDLARCAADARAVFHAARRQWLTEGLSGRALYEFSAEEADRRGWILNLQMNGHRLSDFPHKALFGGSLAEIEFVPASGLWVLEIQLRHPTRPFGAFFEDLLLEDRHFTV